MPYSLQQLGNGLGNIQLFVRGLSENAGIKTLKGVEDNGKPDETIKAVLELFEKETWNDVATDGAKYIVAQENSYFTRLHFDSRVRDILTSRGAYGHSSLPSFSQEALSPSQLEDLQIEGEIVDLLSDSPGIPGFMSVLYRDYLSGPSSYILAFAGTDPTEAADIIENLRQGLGWGQVSQYPAAMDIADELMQDTSSVKNSVYAVGHSLGGGLASAASVVSGMSARTYNAAGLHINTLYSRDPVTQEFILDEFGNKVERYEGSVNRFNSGSSTSVSAYYVDHDLLTFFQTHSPFPNALGASHVMDGPYDTDIALALPWITNPLLGPLPVLAKMGAAHLTSACLYGILVDEVSGVDLLGYEF